MFCIYISVYNIIKDNAIADRFVIKLFLFILCSLTVVLSLLTYVSYKHVSCAIQTKIHKNSSVSV